MKLRLPSLQPFLLHFYMDNLVFRHEVGMNWMGRLRAGSPVVRAHLLMLMTLAISGGGWLAAGPELALFVSGAIWLLAALLAYFAAFALARRSINKERAAGSLDQLCLTLLTDEELFEGKYYGALAPFLEARRYLFVHLALIVAATIAIVPTQGNLAGYIFGLFATFVTPTLLLPVVYIHMMFGIQMGLLSGLHAGALKKSWISQTLVGGDFNVLLPELLIYLKTIPIGVLLFILALVASAMTGGLGLFFAPLVLLIFPYRAAAHLRDLAVQRRQKARNKFKRKIVLE